MNALPDGPVTFTCGSPVRLNFGVGLIDRIGEFCPDAGRILVVAGRSSARKSGVLARVIAALKGKSVAVYDGVESNPSIETIVRGAGAARKHQADLILGIGGGSAMDAAKCIAVLASNDVEFQNLLNQQSYQNRPLRMIAVPTTCGTGSEANRYAIITDLHRNDKVTFASPFTYPAIGILDPSVLDAIPEDILVDTACDAFTHALEGYTSRWSQPFSDTLALEAMALIIGHLPGAVKGQRTARANLLYAASVAGIVIDHTGTTILHAMGYYLTLRHGLSHGKANAILVPTLLTHLEREIPDKLRNVYSLFPAGLQGPDGVERYLEDLGINTSLSACGLLNSEIDDFVAYALGKKNAARTAGSVSKDALTGLVKKHW